MYIGLSERRINTPVTSTSTWIN